jgi:hypothetical protein
MRPWLEIVVPVRNPGAPLRDTVTSLLEQTERGFAVVLSDNWSTIGLQNLDAAQDELEAGDVPVRRVRPTFELGRVQHWNWAHAAARAGWIKPLFVGDTLLPRYVERLRSRIEKTPTAAFVRCEFETRVAGNILDTTRAPFAAQSLTPTEFLNWFPSHGNWLGGPLNTAFLREAFLAAGGYAVQLPACADLNLAVTLSLHHGLETIPEALAAFQFHEQRFSHGIGKRRVNGAFELWLILRMARNYCRTVGLPWPENGVAVGVLHQLKIDYWYPGTKRLKTFLLRQ